jgi:hypothetical protein
MGARRLEMRSLTHWSFMVESEEFFQDGGFFSLSLRCILTSYICKEPQITSLPQTLSALSPNTRKKVFKMNWQAVVKYNTEEILRTASWRKILICTAFNKVLHCTKINMRLQHLNFFWKSTNNVKQKEKSQKKVPDHIACTNLNHFHEECQEFKCTHKKHQIECTQECQELCTHKSHQIECTQECQELCTHKSIR